MLKLQALKPDAVFVQIAAFKPRVCGPDRRLFYYAIQVRAFFSRKPAVECFEGVKLKKSQTKFGRRGEKKKEKKRSQEVVEENKMMGGKIIRSHKRPPHSCLGCVLLLGRAAWMVDLIFTFVPKSPSSFKIFIRVLAVDYSRYSELHMLRNQNNAC